MRGRAGTRLKEYKEKVIHGGIKGREGKFPVGGGVSIKTKKIRGSEKTRGGIPEAGTIDRTRKISLLPGTSTCGCGKAVMKGPKFRTRDLRPEAIFLGECLFFMAALLKSYP